MAYKLATIAVIGLAASATCMGAAAAIGGKDFGNGFDDFSLFSGKPRCEVIAGATAGSRTLDWDGSDHLGLSVNGHASYAPGSGDKVLVSGDPQILAHLRVHDGDIEMDCRGWHDRTKDLAITLPGREFRKFDIAGGGNLILDKLDQAGLKIDIAGSGSVRAQGRIDDLDIDVAGSGKADLNQITARQASIEIAGSGSVRASGKIDTLKMEIAGSGDADFDQITARQAEVGIAGSGTIRAKGSIDDVNIEIEGSGRADFGEVTTRTAKVEIGGHGNVDIAPSEAAKIEISGSGDVNLHSNPKRLDSDISGSGRIHRLGS
jgi:Putative auto-transporter adhesin, head GIN domain